MLEVASRCYSAFFLGLLDYQIIHAMIQRLVFSSHCSKILEVPSQTPLLQALSFSLSITDRFLCSLTSICGSTRSDPVRSLFCSQDYLFAHLGSSPLFQLLLLFRIPSTTSLSGISSLLPYLGSHSFGRLLSELWCSSFLWQVFREPHFDFGNWGLFFFGSHFWGF
ncbi:unnamed protein product [Citrullus colocynthis]|uniref:Uncharacterized protein n=1 Tax=Citrullus colocynthis TaxID=252529 RepID=A0ABP0YZC5_9ROSI